MIKTFSKRQVGKREGKRVYEVVKTVAKSEVGEARERGDGKAKIVSE